MRPRFSLIILIVCAPRFNIFWIRAWPVTYILNNTHDDNDRMVLTASFNNKKWVYRSTCCWLILILALQVWINVNKHWLRNEDHQWINNLKNLSIHWLLKIDKSIIYVWKLFGRKLFGPCCHFWKLYGRKLFGRKLFGRKLFGRIPHITYALCYLPFVSFLFRSSISPKKISNNYSRYSNNTFTIQLTQINFQRLVASRSFALS